MASPRQKASSRKQAKHVREISSETWRLSLAKRRGAQIPAGVLSELAALKLPPWPEVYSAALQVLLMKHKGA